MEKIAEAAAAVGAARRRLAASRVADGVARGALVGAIAGGAAWLVSRWTPGGAGLWPLAAPVLGAACGAVLAMRRGVPTDVAALTLDAAARTDEAFVSALSVRDAAPQVRELVAAHAVERCPPSAVSRFLPFRAPGAATAAVVASALLAALVLVPRATATDRGETHDLNAHIVPVIGATSGSVVRPSEPSDRVRWTKELAEEQGEIHPTWAPAAREDLASVPSDEVRSLAEALASLDGAPAEAAKRALAALDRGDRAAAVEALREALGGAPVAPVGGGSGALTASAPAGSSRGAAWAAATWPLRYDRVVRRWLDDTAATEAQKK